MALAADTLFRRLTRAALLPALLVVAASGLFDYFNARHMAQQAQDSQLLRTAIALATRMSPDEEGESRADLVLHLDPEDAAMLRADQDDEIHFLVLDRAGELLVGDAQLLPLARTLVPAALEQAVFSDGQLDGTAVRVIDFTHQARGATLRVLVTETQRKRAAAARQILFHALWPNLLLLLVMSWLLWRGTRQALAPLQAMGQAIDRREAHDLTPIPVHQVPGEILPLVTAMNGMLERVARASAEQQVFLSGAAHQLRTPLAGIQTQLELAAREAEPVVRERLDRIHGAVDKLTHCTQQMLALARSSAQASSVHDQAPIDLADLLEEAASTWLDVALRRQTELEFEIQPASCLGSRWMLQELLGNLIDNAIKHSPAGAQVTVRCGLDSKQRPFLEVEDQGPGIPVAERDQIFEPFFRSSLATSSGSGLGLAIVREVANRHQASVSLLETPAQRGTRVRITFAAGLQTSPSSESSALA